MVIVNHFLEQLLKNSFLKGLKREIQVEVALLDLVGLKAIMRMT